MFSHLRENTLRQKILSQHNVRIIIIARATIATFIVVQKSPSIILCKLVAVVYFQSRAFGTAARARANIYTIKFSDEATLERIIISIYAPQE